MADERTIADLVSVHRLERLKHEYCRCIDEGDVAGFVDLFTDEATVDFATREPYHGRDEIRGFLETHEGEADRMAHMAVNPLIDVDGDSATGRWNYIVFLGRDDGTELGQGVYHETYRREPDRWRIHSLRTERGFTHTI